MQGYLLLNEQGERLTRNLTWSSRQEAGWLFTVDEVESVLKMAHAENWRHMPVYYQRARLVETENDNYVETDGEPEAL